MLIFKKKETEFEEIVPPHKKIKCLEKLLSLEKKINEIGNEYVKISLIEGKSHENALNRLEIYQKEYKSTYEKCEQYLKY